MTTVTIGKQAERENTPARNELKEEQPRTEQPAAGTSGSAEGAENTGKPYVKYFSSPVPAKKHIRLRGVFIAQLLICAAAGAFVWLGVILGPEELRGAVTEAVLGALNG